MKTLVLGNYFLLFLLLWQNSLSVSWQWKNFVLQEFPVASRASEIFMDFCQFLNWLQVLKYFGLFLFPHKCFFYESFTAKRYFKTMKENMPAFFPFLSSSCGFFFSKASFFFFLYCFLTRVYFDQRKRVKNVEKAKYAWISLRLFC